MNIFDTFVVLFLDGPGEAASKPTPPPTKATEAPPVPAAKSTLSPSSGPIPTTPPPVPPLPKGPISTTPLESIKATPASSVGTGAPSGGRTETRVCCTFIASAVLKISNTKNFGTVNSNYQFEDSFLLI